MAMHVMLPRGAAWDTNGRPDSGATLTVYQSETSTPASIYSDDDLSVPLDNPMEANARGIFPRAYIAAGTYKCVLTYSDATSETYDLTETGVSNISSAVPTVFAWQASDSAALARSKGGMASSSELASLQSSVSSLQTEVDAFPTFGDLAAEDTVTNAFMDTGQIVSSAYGTYTSNSTLSATIPFDDTIPQSGEGTEIISVAYTPKSATNKLRFHFRGTAAGSGGATQAIAALFKNSDADALATGWVTTSSADHGDVIEFRHEMTTGSTSAATFKVRAGPGSTTAFNVRFNGSSSARLFGGTMNASLLIEEIKV